MPGSLCHITTFFIVVGSVKRILSARLLKVRTADCVSAVQGHPTSLVVVAIESAYVTSYQSVMETLVLSCTFSEMLQVSVLVMPIPL